MDRRCFVRSFAALGAGTTLLGGFAALAGAISLAQMQPPRSRPRGRTQRQS